MKLVRLAAATWALAAAISLAACERSNVPSPSAATQAPSATIPTGPPASVQPTPSETLPPLPPVPPAPQAESTLPPLPPGAKVPVALLLPLSGRDAPLGADLLDAAQLALFEAADDSFQLMPRDTAATPDGARAAADKALADGARLVLGPVFRADVSAAAPEAAARGINVIAFSNDRTVAQPGTYLIGIAPDQQIERIVSYAISQGAKRFAALVPEGEFGDRVQASLQRAVDEHGARLIVASHYAADGKDIDDVLRRLANWDERKAAMDRKRRELQGKDDDDSRAALKDLGGAETDGDIGFDALVVPEGGSRLATIGPLLGYYDIDPSKVRILGLATWEAPDLGREPGLVGAWYVAPPTGGREGFDARFKEAYGRPPGPIARLAYDATALAALLARRPGADFSQAALTAPNGFLGAAGIFRFLPSGESQSGLTIYEVTKDGTKVVDPAPDSFMALGQ
jgi:ABC-type branched-subunit amino acid transport system substrate-binding protein